MNRGVVVVVEVTLLRDYAIVCAHVTTEAWRGERLNVGHGQYTFIGVPSPQNTAGRDVGWI